MRPAAFIFGAWFLIYGLGWDLDLFSGQWWFACSGIALLSLALFFRTKDDA